MDPDLDQLKGLMLGHAWDRVSGQVKGRWKDQKMDLELDPWKVHEQGLKQSKSIELKTSHFWKYF